MEKLIFTLLYGNLLRLLTTAFLSFSISLSISDHQTQKTVSSTEVLFDLSSKTSEQIYVLVPLTKQRQFWTKKTLKMTATDNHCHYRVSSWTLTCEPASTFVYLPQRSRSEIISCLNFLGFFFASVKGCDMNERNIHVWSATGHAKLLLMTSRRCY